jgi:putative aldouronate transport system substrate-binding protein
MKQRILAMLLGVSLVLSLLAGCGSTAATSTQTEETETSQVEASTATEEAQEPEEAEAPEVSTVEEPASEVEEEETVDGPVAGDVDFDWSVFEPLTDTPTTLTMFYTQPPALAAIEDSPNDMSYLYQKFEEITNVHIEFQMVSMMDATTNFTLMIASGDYCDIINDALNYYDTSDQAYEDGVALDLLEYEEYVPNFMSLLDEYPDIGTELLTLDEHILNMPRVDMPIGQVADSGLLIRQDWLDDLGLEVPQTYDEMHDVLVAFKSAYNITDPYVMPYQVLSPWGLMAGGYGITATADANNFYVNLETGTVELATISDAYYDYLSMFRDWYAEGIINPDFTSQMTNLPDESIISNEQTGIWFSDLSYIKTYQELLASVNPDAELSLMSDPGVDAERSGYIESTTSVAGSGGFSVTECCDDPELAFLWCDMWYDPDLTQFINYGYEGVTFDYDENGDPVIGGCIVDNDLGLPSLKMANGVYLCTSGGFIYDTHKYDLEYTDLQLEAYTVWLNEADDPSTVTTSGIPSGAKMNVSEADAVSAVMSDITTHVAEMALKFVTGATELNEQTYAQYVQDIENMNLQEALDAEQSAYDRYLSR